MSAHSSYADWIAVDWGTSNLRAWAMREDVPVAEASSGKGMSSLKQSEFEPALLELIEPWLGAGTNMIVACGMVGSRQGWCEAPYAAVPTRPMSPILARPDVRDPRLSVHIVPGLKQVNPPDVMRGEETQIAGFLRKEPSFDGILCLPGTHTKWAQISAGEVVSFRTFMTGETFGLLAKSSVLRHSIGTGWDADAFEAAVSETIARPEAIASKLFALRADDLVNGASQDAARARLSGLLIGMELAAARAYWLGQRIILIGDNRLCAHYDSALSSQGAATELADATAITLAGLASARDQILESAT